MTTKPAELVLIPLRMAAWSRGQQGHPITRGDLIAHSDAGSQYTALRYTEHLALEGIAASIGTVGDAYDNSLMETIIGLFKTEAVRPGPFHTGPHKHLGDVEFTTMAWSTGSTTGACTPPSAYSPPPKPRPLTTLQPLPSTRSRSQYENDTEPVTVHRPWRRRPDPAPGPDAHSQSHRRDPGALRAPHRRGSWSQPCCPRTCGSPAESPPGRPAARPGPAGPRDAPCSSPRAAAGLPSRPRSAAS